MAHLRGSGTCTTALIVSMAESFSNGKVEVDEFPRENRIAIRFVGTIGVPPNMDDLAEALERTLPAHIAYTYIFLYSTWKMYKNETWDSEERETWGAD